MSDVVSPERTALIAALKELEATVHGFQEIAAAVEDEIQGPKLSLAMRATRNLLARHLPEPTFRAPLDGEVLARALRNWPQPPPLDSTLDNARTQTRANIRIVRAGLLAALDDLLPAMRQAYPWVYRIAEGRREITDIDRAHITEVTVQLDAFQQAVDLMRQDRHTKPDFVHQGDMVIFYVRDMTLQVDLARLHLTVNEVILDVPALIDVIDTVDEVSTGFRATITELTGQFSESLRHHTEDTTTVLNGLLRRARLLTEIATKVAADTTSAPNEPEMVLIPPGDEDMSFTMGISETESKREGNLPWDLHARPQHKVTIRHKFLLGKYPVTRGEYAQFAQETNRPWKDPNFAQTDRHPAVLVSHVDALAYAEWLSDRTGQSYRLPTEAEWEYACRAGTMTARYWGEYDDPKHRPPTGHGTAEVGSYPANQWGLHDMLGNVREWCADRWHDNYTGSPTDGSAWDPDASGPRVVRGGSLDLNLRYYRSGIRFIEGPAGSSPWVGFRLARTL